MLISVAELSNLIGLSKVSIYSKLKLKELEPYILKSKGITYITEEGVTLIKGFFNLNDDDLNLKDDILNPLNNVSESISDKISENIENKEIQEIKYQLKELSVDYLNSLKQEIETLKSQLVEKDKQIDELHKLIENNQILLKQEQDKEIKKLQLEEHFNEVDEKLMEIREKMEYKKKPKKRIFKIFSGGE